MGQLAFTIFMDLDIFKIREINFFKNYSYKNSFSNKKVICSVPVSGYLSVKGSQKPCIDLTRNNLC